MTKYFFEKKSLKTIHTKFHTYNVPMYKIIFWKKKLIEKISSAAPNCDNNGVVSHPNYPPNSLPTNQTQADVLPVFKTPSLWHQI
jgi:hypothetical protein